MRTESCCELHVARGRVECVDKTLKRTKSSASTQLTLPPKSPLHRACISRRNMVARSFELFSGTKKAMQPLRCLIGTKKGSSHDTRHTASHYSHSAPYRRTASMAAQPQLGLLPNRWLRLGRINFDHLAADGPYLRPDISKTKRRSSGNRLLNALVHLDPALGSSD